MSGNRTQPNTSLGYAAHLWKAAAAPRGQSDAAEHKHGIVGRLCLKYISGARWRYGAPSTGNANYVWGHVR